VIELTDIRRTFVVGDQPVHALAGVDEVIADGEHVAIMGPSGSGKSTLLNIIGCLDRPSGGSYRLDGHEVGQLPDEELTRIRREQIGFVFQFFHLVPRLTAAGNVELPLLFGGVGRAERRSRVDEALASVGLSGRKDHRPDQLSGGERQRVAISRAVVNRPKILLADEPTGNLDSKSGSAILELLHRLNENGLTLVVVTHDPNVARRADRVILMVDGKVARRMKGSEVPAIVVT
jgi:putative ABC transport system ATP-binding protein